MISKKVGNLDVIVSNTADAAARKLARSLSSYFTKIKHTPILFLCSGGSALSVLDYIDDSVLGSNITIGVLDERFDETNKNNNFTQLKNTEFYKKAKGAGCGFIDTSIKNGETQEMLAGRFEEALKGWEGRNHGGVIVTTLGVGVDGHTSGIMPFPEDENRFAELFEGSRWVVSYDAEGKNPFPKRVTTTITFLKKIHRAFVFVTGEEKRGALLRIQKEGPLAQTPARVLRGLRGGLYVDESAVKE